jgi:deoxyribodipyrimidine photo-lyase
MDHSDRARNLNEKQIQTNADLIVYWMQAAQRADYNHALEHAVKLSNETEKPLAVYFGLTDNYPSANLRHYTFMLTGLEETANEINQRGIKFIIARENPAEGLIKRFTDIAAVIVTDAGFTPVQKKWRMKAASKIKCPLIEVDTDCIVPVWQAYHKQAYSAAVLRPKINEKLNCYQINFRKSTLKKKSATLKSSVLNAASKNSLKITDIQKLIGKLKVHKTPSPVDWLEPGPGAANKTLKYFVKHKLANYDSDRNDPSKSAQSNLSPYLHFGQISSLQIALACDRQQFKKKSELESKKAFLEELIIRRELARNFAFYNNDCDKYKSLHEWSTVTLTEHERDKRQYSYTLAQFEAARTHDPYWNAAMAEAKLTGKMHGYMRMYWGKQILAWTPRPRDAFDRALYLNDKYHLDGRDPNGYAGVAWCFGKHDRPWPERKIFGKVRYMNASGLKRKFDIDAYVARIDQLSRELTDQPLFAT